MRFQSPIGLVFLFALALAPLFVVYAAAPADAPSSLEALYKAVCTLANWLFGFFLLLAVLSFLYVGFLFLTGGAGNAEKIGRARTFLLYVMVGTAIVFLSRALVFIVGGLVGAQITATTLGCS